MAYLKIFLIQAQCYKYNQFEIVPATMNRKTPSSVVRFFCIVIWVKLPLIPNCCMFYLRHMVLHCSRQIKYASTPFIHLSG